MKTGSLNYLERKPTIQTDLPAPLLVLLHGYGSNEADLFSFAAELPKSLHIVSLQAPHELGYNSYAWYNINFDANQNKFSDLAEASISADRIATFIQEFTENPMIDANKVFLLGFSQGAILSYGLALNSTKIHHVIALSGYLNEDLITGDPAQKHCRFLCLTWQHGPSNSSGMGSKSSDLLKTTRLGLRVQRISCWTRSAPSKFS